MSATKAANDGHFVWHEHLTTDSEAAIAFYADVVGWQTQPFGDTDYKMWVGSQGPLGGVMKLSERAIAKGAKAHWIGNVQVSDVDAVVASVQRLGGNVQKEPQDVPNAGRFAVVADPQGASLVVLRPLGTMNLHDASVEGEFCWNELVTTDSKAALKFYSELFGWKILHEMDLGPIGTYRIFGIGEKPLGGMMDAGMQPAWHYYVQIRDLDAAIKRALNKGATMVRGPHEDPEGARIAHLLDPQGAAFALREKAKSTS
jgi:uncharacterized protein